MSLWTERKIRMAVLVWDVLTISAGFLTALLVRFSAGILAWQLQLYSTVYLITLFSYLLISIYINARKRAFADRSQGAVEILSHLIQERFLMYCLLIVLLFVSHNFQQLSRLVLLVMVTVDVAVNYPGRLLLRRIVLRREQEREPSEHYVVITAKGQESLARARAMEMLPVWADFVQVRIVEPEMSELQIQCDLLNDLPEKVHILVYLRGYELRELSGRVVRCCRERGLTVSETLFSQEQELPSSMIRKTDRTGTVEFPGSAMTGKVFGVRFAVSNVDAAAFTVLSEILDGRGKGSGRAGSLSGRYICFSNVHTTVTAHDDEEFREILNRSAYTFADGAPIASRLRREGFPESERVAGPDFMDAVFRATMDGSVTHYFYGSTLETIEKLGESLENRYPGIRIAGLVSPPFRPETKEEDAATVAAMNDSGAAMIWVGLGAPKQERWMAAHAGRVNGVMLGVGAGFNFYAGTVKRAPKWIQKIGLEWLYRLLKDPKRLASRYIVTNVKYGWYLVKEKSDRQVTGR